MAEVHLIGTLVGASGFPRHALCCKYSFAAGDDWVYGHGTLITTRRFWKEML